MKKLVFLFFLMASLSLSAQSGKAKTVKKTFSRTTTVSNIINSDISIIYGLLTNAEDYPYWTSTVISIEGNIAEGEKIRLISSLDESRTFKLKIKEMVKDEKLVWGDAMGTRTYSLSQTENGVLFNMTEKIGGFMFPLFAKKIPSFDESFEKFAADLKVVAELNN